MTIEFVLYLLIFMAAIFFCFIQLSDALYNISTSILFIVFSIVVRTSGFDADIGNYAEYLKIDSFSIYYIKEAFYWIVSRFIYKFTDSALMVFLTYDLLFFTLLLSVRSKLRLPQYFPYMVMLFFVTVMGMQNVFRQFISSGFLLLLFSQFILSKRMFVKILSLALAALSHNVALLFFPIIFLKSKSKKVSFLFLFASASVLILLPIAGLYKSNSITGVVPAYIYGVIFFILIFGYLSIFKFKLKTRPPIFTQFFYVLLFFYLLIMDSIFFLGGAQSKRIAMICLFLTLIPLVLSLEANFKNRVIVRICFIIFMALPTILFDNSMNLLKTTPDSLYVESYNRTKMLEGKNK